MLCNPIKVYELDLGRKKRESVLPTLDELEVEVHEESSNGLDTDGQEDGNEVDLHPNLGRCITR